MAYVLPTFNLAVKIWRPSHSKFGPADVTTIGNLALGRRTSQIPGSFATEAPDVGCMWLLLPAGTDVRDKTINGGPDVVEVAAGTGRFYNVVWVDDVAAGFPNEHRFAALSRQFTAIPPLPKPDVIPPTPSVVFLELEDYTYYGSTATFNVTHPGGWLTICMWCLGTVGSPMTPSCVSSPIGGFVADQVVTSPNDTVNEITYYTFRQNIPAGTFPLDFAFVNPGFLVSAIFVCPGLGIDNPISNTGSGSPGLIDVATPAGCTFVVITTMGYGILGAAAGGPSAGICDPSGSTLDLGGTNWNSNLWLAPYTGPAPITEHWLYNEDFGGAQWSTASTTYT